MLNGSSSFIRGQSELAPDVGALFLREGFYIGSRGEIIIIDSWGGRGFLIRYRGRGRGLGAGRSRGRGCLFGLHRREFVAGRFDVGGAAFEVCRVITSAVHAFRGGTVLKLASGAFFRCVVSGAADASGGQVAALRGVSEALAFVALGNSRPVFIRFERYAETDDFADSVEFI